MKTSIKNRLRAAKRRIERRLAGAREDAGQPALSAGAIHVEMADKTRAFAHGSIGLIRQPARATGLVEAIDRHVLKVHRPCPGR